MSANVQAELVDRLIELYCDWRAECWAVRSAYGQFTAASAEDRTLAYAAYRAALDREEAAADVYAEQLTVVASRASTDSRRTSLFA
ncbi:MAG TPA: hypothetical protein VGF91_00260 [Solirubrobacteraceae bacterium]|jgi:hypothetical protein